MTPLRSGWLTIATVGVLFSGAAASWATESGQLFQFPNSPRVELRALLQAELRGDTNRPKLEKLISLGAGRARTGLIAVEEASQYLADPSPGVGGRIRRVMGFAETILDEATLNESDRSLLRGYLNLHLKLFRAYRPRSAIQMLYRHQLWDAEHLPYLVAQVDDTLGRRQTYRALVDLRSKMTDEQLRFLRERLRANPPHAIEKLAMQDEFDELDPPQYAAFIKRLQTEFCAEKTTPKSYNGAVQEIKLRALLRVQSRLQRKDPATMRAFMKASGTPGSALGATFFRRLGANEFSVALNDETFNSADPLELTTLPTTNVVQLVCARKLDSLY